MQIYQCKHALLTSCKCKSLTLLIDLCKASPRQCRYEEKITGIRGTFRNQLSKRKRDKEGRVNHRTLIIIWSGKNKLKSIWKKRRICCFGFVYKQLNTDQKDAFSFVLSVQDSITSSTSCCYIWYITQLNTFAIIRLFSPLWQIILERNHVHQFALLLEKMLCKDRTVSCVSAIITSILKTH